MAARFSQTLLLAVIFALVAGCGGGKTAVVTGTITVDGQPADKGSISMFPDSGAGPTAGGEIVNGKYTIPDAPIGLNKVEIRVSKVIGKKMIYKGSDGKEDVYSNTYGEVLPEKYNVKSELKLEVTSGKNEKNWDLSTK